MHYAVGTGRWLTFVALALASFVVPHALPGTSQAHGAESCIEIELEKNDAFQAWQQAGYSRAEKAALYRALYNRRFVYDSVVSTEFTSSRLRNAVERYQASIAACRTGYLSRSQTEELLAAPGQLTPWQRNPDLKQEVRKKLFSENSGSKEKQQWKNLALPKDTKTNLYRALYQRGYVNDPKPVIDFMNRMDLIQAVAYFQKERGAPASGFLTEAQVKILLRRKATPTPYEIQEALFEKYSEEAVTDFLSQVAAQEFAIAPTVDANLAPYMMHLSAPEKGPVDEKRLEAWSKMARATTAEFGENWNFKLEITMLQGLLELPATGYISEELLERAKELGLNASFGEVHSRLAMLQPRLISSVKDWKRWKIQEFNKCEIATSAVDLDGFLGNKKMPSIHFFHNADWPNNQVNWSLDLVNWDMDTLAEIQVAGRVFHLAGTSTDPVFVAKDGSKLSDEGSAYSDFISAVAKANGFEIHYKTEFGTDVLASFSALGFTKQFRALRHKC
ncbi:hypothetical protein [Roseibium marinum]|uniref:Peptidoglycan binding-like domain-containing protein n=1 Tax=Roseibium marinum TaxID=281252 RepID=A0A2S3UMD8_9HYPH|nr:hypothetical protein [Roseibium marinum]POF28888.1 hypothetical protein CLV41_111139 [Roseibium marinum]